MSERDEDRTRQARDPAGPGRPEDPALSGRFAMRDPGGQGTSPAKFAGLGFQLLVSILLFLYLGKWLDRKLGTTPWLLILGVFLGAGAGFYAMYKQLTAAQAAEDRAREAARREGRG